MIVNGLGNLVHSRLIQYPAERIDYMKRIVLIATLICITLSSYATHIAAGELTYTYQGPGVAPNTSKYTITMRLFRECESVGQALSAETVNIGIYHSAGLNLFTTLSLPLSGPIATIQNTNGANPCLNPFVSLCYQIGTFTGTIDLPNSADGYTLSWIRYTRTTLENVTGTFVGATFVTKIPGTTSLPTGQNSSPQFVTRDTSTICKNTSFTLDFSATDANGDSLVYYFSPAYDGTTGTNANPNPPPPPTLSLPILTYLNPYSGTQPLGPGVTINSQTGIISGIAPAAPNRYVICVTVEEWRNGVKINEHRKDFIIKVGDCTSTAAELAPSYITCDGFSWNFQNESSSSGITGYLWNFGDPGSGANNTSTQPAPTHTFSDTGRFTIKLTVTTGACQDSATTVMSVYPGFTPNFNVSGACFQSPFQFTDATVTAYGIVDTWKWNFGDLTTNADTSLVKNPSYQYPSSGIMNVQLIVTNSKGCIDTLIKPVTVRDNPILNLPFRDTLICSIDTLQLIGQGNGIFTWTPNYNIINPNTATPLVYPKDTTQYIVTLNENGCIKQDTITVNVLDFIAVELGQDTGICRTDSIILNTTSHALSYIWTPATGLSSTTVKYPKASPLLDSIRYYVTANLGKCQARDSILIRTAPYPIANAGDDETICFGDRVTLNANYTGTSFTWSPVSTLINSTSLTPQAAPTATTNYIFTAYSQGICPLPKSDTVTVTVIPEIHAFAGNDTIVVANQPLQLNATGATNYLWSPTFGMSSSTIPNPIVTLNASYDSVTYVVRASDANGCFDTDDIKVKVFKTGPEIFVPSGFTPNNDGKNDNLKPILVGMQQLDYFRIYNRWGQLVYQTSVIGQGWNGKLSGIDQPSGTFVYSAQAIDYSGNKVTRKGTIVLIR